MQRRHLHSPAPQGEIVRAEIIGSDRCMAEGCTVRAVSPVLALARLLITAGRDPAAPLEAWRGEIRCLKIRSIATAAGLTVKERPFGPVFESWAPFPAPPVSPRIAPFEPAASCTPLGGAR